MGDKELKNEDTSLEAHGLPTATSTGIVADKYGRNGVHISPATRYVKSNAQFDKCIRNRSEKQLSVIQGSAF